SRSRVGASLAPPALSQPKRPRTPFMDSFRMADNWRCLCSQRHQPVFSSFLSPYVVNVGGRSHNAVVLGFHTKIDF
ncbi:MAG TPA: hypothetical protein VE222_02015, partial [Nitrospiraceae bacterium]|nr:hypothetical protein [Nitrospiraceae bacterium]